MNEPKGLSRAEIRVCDHCKEPIGMTPYRVTVEQHFIDPKAVQQLAGLEMMMGGHTAIAQVFSPHSEYTHVLNTNRLILCQDCALSAPWAFSNCDIPEAVKP